MKLKDIKDKLKVGDILCWGKYHQYKVEVVSINPIRVINLMKGFKKEPRSLEDDFEFPCVIRDGKKLKITDINNMKETTLQKLENYIGKLVEQRLTESLQFSKPFPNKREAMLAVNDVIDGTLTEDDFIQMLFGARNIGNIEPKDFKLLLGQLAVQGKRDNFKFKDTTQRIIDKNVTRTNNVFNETKLNESLNLNSLKLNNIVRFKDGEEWKVVKPGIRNGKIFMKPFNPKAKSANISLPIEFTPEQLLTATLVNESKLNENPLPAPQATQQRVQPKAVAPQPAPVQQPQGIDPAWKLDMVEFLGNSLQGMAKQFLYQAKKSNPKATPDMISALADDMLDSGQVVELVKTRLLASIKAAL